MKHSLGTVLILALLFLALISFLLVAALDMSIMETKMSVNFKKHTLAFQAADSSIRMAELSLTKIKIETSDNSNTHSHYSITFLENQGCQRLFQIKAIGQFETASSQIEEVYSVARDSDPACTQKSAQVGQRISWREISME